MVDVGVLAEAVVVRVVRRKPALANNQEDLHGTAEEHHHETTQRVTFICRNGNEENFKRNDTRCTMCESGITRYDFDE